MIDKDQIVEEIREEVKLLFPSDRTHQSCLYATAASLVVLHRHGIKAIPQAGDMCWPRITEEKDDGVSPTHWSYVWSPDDYRSAMAIAAGKLPEIHIWVGILDTNEVLDINTKFFPRACKESLGIDWDAPDPPDFLWTREIPDGVVYRPIREATIFASNLVVEVIKAGRPVTS